MPATNAMMEEATRACIDACAHCHQICLETAMNHCLETGGEHVAPEHFRLMLGCAQLCRLSADFMLSGVRFHHRLCGLCAEVCEACAHDCERIGGMERCVAACRACAQSCRQMAGSHPLP
ncbi:four-helix bundle copper-binding protein [Methylomagnum ishizawai]|uniref:four-helix bundle copper-binding protein n=1 Tax=Methylomagnum ishizawai TaxID=1760988 RepID=UPI001C326C91|nr:four-helix bundle copper-binding protein [Methylomagnum ishizawai]BBL77403.1 ferredoxin [Methylomagnum ishizawai]